MIVYAVVDDSLAQTNPLGDAIDTYIRREDAERFTEQVRGDDPELASYGSRSVSLRPAGSTEKPLKPAPAVLVR